MLLARNVCLVNPRKQRAHHVRSSGLRIQDLTESEQLELHALLFLVDQFESGSDIEARIHALR